jgi:RimJ/RimL family protein N-acetyltransferase
MALELLCLDRAALAAAMTDDDTLARHLGVAVVPGWMPDRDALVVAASAPEGPWGAYALVDRDAGGVVGNAGFFGPPSDRGEVELGYAVAASLRGRGIATAAVEALVTRAWAEPAVVAVIARSLASNGASRRVLDKAGFVEVGSSSEQEGELVHHRLERGAVAPLSRRAPRDRGSR